MSHSRYYRNTLLAIRSTNRTPSTSPSQLAALGLLHYRGSWAGRLKQRTIRVVNRSRDTIGTSSCKQIWSSRSRQRTVNVNRVCVLIPVKREPVAAKIVKLGVFNAQSANSKYAAISDRISTNLLSLCTVVKTWNDGTDSPSLISRVFQLDNDTCRKLVVGRLQ